jgi:hypothetical protein
MIPPAKHAFSTIPVVGSAGFTQFRTIPPT